MTPRRRLALGLFAVVALLVTGALVSGCSTTHPRRDPTGERFPTVRGTSLDDRTFELPGDLAGREAVLFVGYKQNSQFDIDRWLLGLSQIGLAVPVYEVPTIPGLIPGMFAGTIDSGMRSGIPEEDWAIVITLYDDADEVARFLGNENPMPARVVLLDRDGNVAFFHDRGYSTASLRRLEETLSELTATGVAK